MELIADILLAAGALGAGIYCFVLGRRLNRFNDLENGVGGAVAVLSAQVDDLSKTLESAQSTAEKSANTLTDLTERAEAMAKRLELQMASMHDIPNPSPPQPRPAVQPQTTGEPMFVRHRGARVHQ
jgi:methyl-accepting chemotaxis protein